eukprot:TRINITY_DN82288_c0_g1_i1.p1 TRINITY_DN82288_c0_g1~~TRINITY_DN82288_c0_g1_i1.p1  ORF type:complete len:343 (+),score=34.42 TRINITY_DN82288_c0_g1_i1:63-1091(+)
MPLDSPSDELLAAAKWLADAEAILVCAGAGMSAKEAAAKEAVYVSEEDFALRYPYMRKHGYRTAYECMGLFADRRVAQEAKWGFWSDHYYNLRYKFKPSEGHYIMKDLIGDRPTFVLTSNVDGGFERSGWDKDRIYTPQGDVGYYQCLQPCSNDAVFETTPLFEKLHAVRNSALGEVEASSVPKCKLCSGPVFMNLRGGKFFLHTKYAESHRSFMSWIDEVIQSGKKLVVIEIGCGFNTPMVTRFPCEAIVREAAHNGAALVRVNPQECDVPSDLSRAVGLSAGWGIPSEIKQAVQDVSQHELELAEACVCAKRTTGRQRPSRRTTQGHDFDWRQMMRGLAR